MTKEEYKDLLYHLQVELVKFQKHVIESNMQVCVIFEGRDTAGKDGIIKRFLQHLSPREVRTVALGKPSEKDQLSWYFQRYVPHLPSGQEITLFNRSWYNRAGVERVMKFCTENELQSFFQEVGNFEQMLTHSGMIFFKYYLDISKPEQKRRLEDRKNNPLKQWKLSPIDDKAQKLWKEYSKARDDMFIRTSFNYAPWFVVNACDKRTARINVIRHFLSQMEYDSKNEPLLAYDPNVVCRFDQSCYQNGFIQQ
ncbi:MAG: polyphosphate kinase 2 [Crocinitomicaceae bacterium]|nr:polyphosphate kinase 2 [Crocinitomicaceae bacterium]|tara:strand:+ start:1813 stop:2571 length:759 start_codon:yes stop_codon:yes gene_type:complete